MPKNQHNDIDEDKLIELIDKLRFSSEDTISWWWITKEGMKELRRKIKRCLISEKKT